MTGYFASRNVSKHGWASGWFEKVYVNTSPDLRKHRKRTAVNRRQICITWRRKEVLVKVFLAQNDSFEEAEGFNDPRTALVFGERVATFRWPFSFDLFILYLCCYSNDKCFYLGVFLFLRSYYTIHCYSDEDFFSFYYKRNIKKRIMKNKVKDSQNITSETG